MALKVCETEVLAKFDRLVKKGELHYSPPKRLHITEDKFQFQISISPALTRKPLYTTPAPTRTTTNPAPQPPLFSDPDPDFHIASLPPSHALILNKYCVLRPQYILHSTTPQKQSDYLNLQDWTAAWTALGAIGARSVVTYNCGEAAGASRSHKHLQILPYAACVGKVEDDTPGSFSMFPDAVDDAVARAELPFSYCIARTLPRETDAQAPRELKRIYDGLVEQAIKETGFRGGEQMAHNLVMVREWMLLIPRSKARVGKCVTGATGVVGMVWVGSEAEAEEWRRVGFLRALGEMGMRGSGE